MSDVTEPVTMPSRVAFLEALSECGSVREACKQAGVVRMTVYRWRERDETFAQEWEEAARIGAMGLEDEARRRAYIGVDRPVYQTGKLVGVTREYSDPLLMFLLKGAMPDKYRERVSTEITGAHGGPIEHAYGRVIDVDPTALDQIERLLLPKADAADAEFTTVENDNDGN
jgi:hypothetical protein